MFEKFVGYKKRSHNVNFIYLNETFFRFGKYVSDKYVKEYKFVDIYFNKDDNQIGLRFSKEKGALKLTKSNGSCFCFSAKGFVNAFKIKEKGRFYLTKKDENFFIIDLNKKN